MPISPFRYERRLRSDRWSNRSGESVCVVVFFSRFPTYCIMERRHPRLSITEEISKRGIFDNFRRGYSSLLLEELFILFYIRILLFSRAFSSINGWMRIKVWLSALDKCLKRPDIGKIILEIAFCDTRPINSLKIMRFFLLRNRYLNFYTINKLKLKIYSLSLTILANRIFFIYSDWNRNFRLKESLSLFFIFLFFLHKIYSSNINASKKFVSIIYNWIRNRLKNDTSKFLLFRDIFHTWWHISF